MVSWKQYYQEHTKGKKFAKGEIQEHMRKLAKDYHEMKGKGMSMRTAGEGMEKEEKEEVKEEVKMPAFLKEGKKEEEETGSVKEEEKLEEMEGGGKKMRKVRRIDFSKIHWGAFTDDWQQHGGKKKYKTLNDFSKAVLKSPKDFGDITVKRARFYKNIIRKGKGLSML